MVRKIKSERLSQGKCKWYVVWTESKSFYEEPLTERGMVRGTQCIHVLQGVGRKGVKVLQSLAGLMIDFSEVVAAGNRTEHEERERRKSCLSWQSSKRKKKKKGTLRSRLAGEEREGQESALNPIFSLTCSCDVY